LSNASGSAWPDPGDDAGSPTPVPVTPDELHHVESQLVPEARRLDRSEQERRRAADAAIVRALRADGCQGGRTDQFLRELAAYGWPIVQRLISNGAIFAHSAARGRPLPRPAPEFAWTRDERTELATETILKAVPLFRLHAVGAKNHVRAGQLTYGRCREADRSSDSGGLAR
jgi:hypothetical protein